LVGDEVARLPRPSKRNFSPAFHISQLENIEVGAANYKTGFGSKLYTTAYKEFRDSATDAHVQAIINVIPENPTITEAKSYYDGIHDDREFYHALLFVTFVINLLVALVATPIWLMLGLWEIRAQNKISALRRRRDWLISHQLNYLGFETIGLGKVQGSPIQRLDKNGYTPPIPGNYHVPEESIHETRKRIMQLTGIEPTLLPEQQRELYRSQITMMDNAVSAATLLPNTPSTPSINLEEPLLSPNIIEVSSAPGPKSNINWKKFEKEYVQTMKSSNYEHLLQMSETILLHQHEVTEEFAGDPLSISAQMGEEMRALSLFSLERYEEAIPVYRALIQKKRSLGFSCTNETDMLMHCMEKEGLI
jgi:hypothetical protein